MPTIATLKQVKRALIDRHVRRDDMKGLGQVVLTLVPLGLLWVAAAWAADVAWWLVLPVVAAMSLFLLRSFVLMHECGHGSLFRTEPFNRAFGFLFGVVTGMPQYVWSRHHHHHHSTNGNWNRYRGPLNIIPVDEYAAMSAREQRRYRNARSIWLAPIAGFFYLIFNPRINWLIGTVGLFLHVVQGKFAHPETSLKTLATGFKTPHWASWQEYRHMSLNNLVLVLACGAMAWAVGPTLFFLCWTVSLSVAGGAGIVLFTVQHNFEHSYASHDEGWDYDRAALEGTSFLVLPGWLNWFSANIAYHHVHHLSARIPNYCLAQCHNEYQHLFTRVTRIRLSEIPGALRCILWDTRLRCIVSVAEYDRQRSVPVTGA
ncbi:MAG: fatty acid desaturase [Burkholderiales bacterium]|nr:fatty acid desaturase [Burkholderiales bacterium]